MTQNKDDLSKSEIDAILRLERFDVPIGDVSDTAIKHFETLLTPTDDTKEKVRQAKDIEK